MSVYFIQQAGYPHGPIKIGLSLAPQMRLQEFQQGSPVELALLATMRGGYKEENALHAKFAGLRLHGEWFMAADQLRSFIESQAIRFHAGRAQFKRDATSPTTPEWMQSP